MTPPGTAPESAYVKARAGRPAPLYALLVVVVISALWVMLGSNVVSTSREHDFLNLYTGAALARDGNFAEMHSPDTQLAREREYVPGLGELVPFVRPPFYAALLAPLAWVAFAPAFWVWVGVQVAVLLGIWRWALREWGADALILASLFLPTALGIAHGQDCVFMAAIVTGVYVLARREKEFSSGLVLGLGLVKFHLFLLWPLALLVQRRWRMTAGACAAVAAELAVSLALAGPEGLARYYALLQMKDLNRLSPSPELMVNVHSLAIHFGSDTLAVKATLVALVVVAAGVACWRAPLWRGIGAACAGSLLVAPHVYGYDAALLLTPLLLAVHESGSKATRIAATAVLTPVPFLLALGGVPWAAAAPLALLAFLGALALPRPQTSAAVEAAPSA